MTNKVISIENVSKQYHLGVIGTGTFKDDFKSWWAKTTNKPDPLQKVDEIDYGNREKDILWALKSITFSVDKGEALGIIGKNGAGKSTLLKILSRVTTPTSGEIKVKGRIASLLEVGTGFHPELTGRENIFLNGAIMGMNRAEVARKFDEIVDFSGVEKFIDTPVKRYSSGMYVRLAFAVAAHLEPEILIVDEVLAVGDVEFQKKCLGKMKDVKQKEGRTVLFVSHNMQAINRICQNCMHLEYGEIINFGQSADVINNYLRSEKLQDLNADLLDQIKMLPSNEFFRLLEINLFQNGKKGTGKYQNRYNLDIEIKYQVKKPMVGFRVFFDLLDPEENVIFRSFHDETKESIIRTEQNLYVSKVTIPANMLGPFDYYLCFHAGIHNGKLFTGEGIKLKISIENTGLYNRAYLSDPVRGKLAIHIPWNTEVIN